MKKTLAAIFVALGLAADAAAATIDLANVRSDTTIPNGSVVTGTLGGNHKVSIAAGATVTISNAVVSGSAAGQGAYNWGGDGAWAGLTCIGSATIVLKGSNTVIGGQTWPAIYVPEGSRLVIRGGGSLDAIGGDAAAGIGGGWGIYCGSIEIQGGTITAGIAENDGLSIPADGAGIGGGYMGGCDGITISGGTVTATGRGAGIGGGYGSVVGDIVISGGSVTAGTLLAGHAGIGGGAGGKCGDITISGGTVSAAGGSAAAGIGGGRNGECGEIEIGSAVVRVEATCLDSTGVPIGTGSGGSGGNLTLGDGLFYSTSGNTGAVFRWNGDLALLACDATIPDGMTIYGTLGGNYKVSIAAGATVTISNAVVRGSAAGQGAYNWGGSGAWAGLTCLGSATIVLEGSNTVTGGQTWPAIYVPEGCLLAIRGNGSLDAIGGDAAAGIGGGWGIYCGSIEIQGGTITAGIAENDGLSIPADGAGIGGGYMSGCEGITISGGTVTATGRGAGIGGGYGSVVDDIVISGGSVTARTLLAGHAGIGGGAGGKCGDITISGGTVSAAGGSAAAGIGGGRNGECGEVEIGPAIVRVEATCFDGSTVPVGTGSGGSGGHVTLAAGLTDATSGNKRTITRWNGDLALLTGDATALDGMTIYGTLGGNYKVSIEDGATVAISNVTINGVNSTGYMWAGLTCLGDATIVLEGDSSVTGFYEDYPGIFVPVGKTLNIQGRGSLSASGSVGSSGKRWSTGIGAGWSIPCGSIVIAGGTITATGGSGAAGIGGAYSADCGAVEILGGAIAATGGGNAPGIGKCVSLTIGAGIDWVAATRGAEFLNDPIQDGGTPFSAVPDGLHDVTSVDGATRTIYRLWNGDLEILEGDATAVDGTVIRGTLRGLYKVSIAHAAEVTLRDAYVTNGVNSSSYSWAGLTCLGDATVVLEGESAVKGFYEDYPGIFVPPGRTLTITGGGSLTADSNGWAAGIGGGYKIDCGTVAIEGGSVKANGGSRAAGIGGGYNASCDGVSIGPGIVRVTANGGSGSAKPIGAGDGGTCPEPEVAAVLSDTTDGNTRTIRPFDLGDLAGDRNFEHDMIVTGTLGGRYRITVADGATLTLRYATIAGVDDSACRWAGITCLGDATIVLEGENSVRGFYSEYPGIFVPPGKTLTIKGDGSLEAGSNGVAAGIGAGYANACGSVVIEGGRITATGGTASGAGIGGATSARCDGVAVRGGTVVAVGGGASAGIGGGSMASCGSIVVGGDAAVTATGGSGAAGIGAGEGWSGLATCSGVSIEGGTVSATGGRYAPGIGSGYKDSTCGQIGIGPAVTRVVATSGVECGNPIGAGVSGRCGTVTVAPGLADVTEGSTRVIEPRVRDLSKIEAGDYFVSGEILTGTLGISYGIVIADGATVTLRDATIVRPAGAAAKPSAGIECLGDATIILEGENTVSGMYSYYPGVFVPPGKTLTIKGEGSLTASSSADSYGYRYGAGIGGGYEVACGNIVIAGGTIHATGGDYAAGIGGGYKSACGTITISGGTVTAVGGRSAAGIGSGAISGASCGAVTIGPGINRVVATCGLTGSGAEAILSASPIGAGRYGTCDGVTLVGDLSDETRDGGQTRVVRHASGASEATGFDAWADENGVAGAWNEKDASGIANVFRYAFDKPIGAFSDPPLLGIAFNAEGRAVVKTPPLVNGEGFTFTIMASDEPDGTGNALSWPLNGPGETVIGEPTAGKRFFRLRAEER